MCKLDAAAAPFGWKRSLRAKSKDYLNDVADQCGVDATQFPALNGELKTDIQNTYMHACIRIHRYRCSEHICAHFHKNKHAPTNPRFSNREISFTVIGSLSHPHQL